MSSIPVPGDYPVPGGIPVPGGAPVPGDYPVPELTFSTDHRCSWCGGPILEKQVLLLDLRAIGASASSRSPAEDEYAAAVSEHDLLVAVQAEQTRVGNRRLADALDGLKGDAEDRLAAAETSVAAERSKNCAAGDHFRARPATDDEKHAAGA